MSIKSFNLTMLVNLIVILLFAHSSYAETKNVNTHMYSINVAGCPTKLKLHIPSYFTRPITSSETQDRDNIINKLHGNPGRKARYSEIFLTDWNSKETFPIIMVSSLGSLIKRQGKINIDEWRKLKSYLLKLTESQRKEVLRTGVMRLVENSDITFDFLSTRISSIVDPKENSIVTLAISKATVLERTINTLNAAKMIYNQNCIAYITVAVDAAPKNAFITLTNIISEIDIK